MIFQACMDESEGANGTFALAGLIATAGRWKTLQEAWEILLPDCGVRIRRKEGGFRYVCKTSLVVQKPDWPERIAAFYGLIGVHTLGSISVHLNRHDLARVFDRFWDQRYIPKYPSSGQRRRAQEGERFARAYLRDPYSFAFRTLMDTFHFKKHELAAFLPPDSKVDFIFDEHSKQAMLFQAWDEYVKNRPAEIRKRFGARPIPRSDDTFMPLQAADLWAWWVRKWRQEGVLHERLKDAKDWGWTVYRAPPAICIDLSEDDIENSMLNLLNLVEA